MGKETANTTNLPPKKVPHNKGEMNNTTKSPIKRKKLSILAYNKDDPLKNLHNNVTINYSWTKEIIEMVLLTKT